MCLFFTLITGNCDVLECAPVLLITLQCQFLGSGKYTTDRRRHVRPQVETHFLSQFESKAVCVCV